MRRSMGLLGPAATALMTVVAVSACAPERYDWHAPAIEQARERVVPATQATVAAVVAGLDPHGTAERDACEVGQDNVKVHDEYRTRCAAGVRAVAGLDAQDLEQAVDEAQARLDAAGCTGQPAQAQPPAVWGGVFQCGDTDVTVEIGLVLDNRFRDQAGTPLPGPCCGLVADRTFDPVEAFVAANLAGHRYMLVATAFAEYYAVCREGQTVATYRECPPVQ